MKTFSNPAQASRGLRTSASDPLRIDSLAAGTAGGRIGITFCPGKKGPSMQGPNWDRDLDTDLDAVAAWAPAAVLTLIEDQEFDELRVRGLGEGVRARGMAWFHLPIRDVDVPDERFESAWRTVGPQVVQMVERGQRVVVHCRGGLGRAGLVSARLLVEMGRDGQQAVRRVRAARTGSIETSAQERHVLQVAARLRQPSDWFEALTGFRESTGPDGYDRTRQRLAVEGNRLRSLASGRSVGMGTLELASLAECRQRGAGCRRTGGPNQLRIVCGDVGALHTQAPYAGALFQVASQFNLLEMVGPHVTPEHGVTVYQHDRTQGPACALAAGAATIYRNYLVPVGAQQGQTSHRQLDGFAELGAALAGALGRPADTLWAMKNGYAMFTEAGLASLSSHVSQADEAARDHLRQLLRIGLHWDVEVTSAGHTALPGPVVSQAFCSALPVGYHANKRPDLWAPLAGLVLEAAYEATLWAAVMNAARGQSATVLLTLLGGGVFGNDPSWICQAISRAVRAVDGHGLDIVLVCRHKPGQALLRWWEGLRQR